MRIERARGPRRLRRLLPALVVILGVSLPVGLWLRHGRRHFVEVTIEASAYVVGSGQPLVLQTRLRPQQARLSWSGPGIDHADGRRLEIAAPKTPGIYTVAAEARLGGSRASDRLSIEVLARPPNQLPLSRPASRPIPRHDLPGCGSLPTVQVHGRACPTANLVVELEDAVLDETADDLQWRRRYSVWHWWSDRPAEATRGSLANLRVPADASPGSRLEIVTQREVLRSAVSRSSSRRETNRCAQRRKTTVQVADCAADLADFSWQLIGPGHFRFAAEPARGERAIDRYEWDFGDGLRRRGRDPQTVVRFAQPRRHRVVRLRVRAGSRTAETLQVIHDRSMTP